MITNPVRIAGLAPAAERPAVPVRPVASSPAAPVPAAAPAPAAVDAAVLAMAAEAVNKFARSFASGLEFSVDLAKGETIVRVVESETGRLIRQIPSEEMLAIARALDRLQGLLLDGKA